MGLMALFFLSPDNKRDILQPNNMQENSFD